MLKSIHAFRSLKYVSLYHLSCKNLPWQPAIFLSAHKGASNGKIRSGSQVGRQPSDISLVAIVNEWSFCVEWHVWVICILSGNNCYLSTTVLQCVTVAEYGLELINQSCHSITAIIVT